MKDDYVSPHDTWPMLPIDAGFREAAKRAWEYIFDIDWDAAGKFLEGIRDAVDVRGDPDKLDGGVKLMYGEVAPSVGEAREAIQRANASFTTAWIGRGAEAFQGYVPILTGAITQVETNANLTAEAVGDFRLALQALWIQIVEHISTLVNDVYTAVMSASGKDAEGKKKSAKPAVLNLVMAFVNFVKNIYVELEKLDAEKYKASDKIAQVDAGHTQLVPVGSGPGGRAAMHYVGPTGYQLPVPNTTAADPNWDPTQIKDRWMPKSQHSPAFSQVPGGRGVAIDTGMMQELINAFRDNGTYWNKAMTNQIKVNLNYFTPQAFGAAGQKFYQQVSKVMTRDYLLYLHSDARMDAVGGLLDKINEAYGAEDQHSSQVFKEYITNEPIV
jgi:hypothetical protein